MTSKHQNSQYGGHTFNLLSKDPSQYIARYCTANVSPNSLHSGYATSVGSSAIVTENVINETYTLSPATPEHNVRTAEFRLEQASITEGRPYFVSGQARARTITEPVNSCSIACNYSPIHMSQPFLCSCITFPPGPWTRQNQQNTNTLFYLHAASVPYSTYMLDMDREIENLGQELAPVHIYSPLSASQPYKPHQMPRPIRHLAPTLPSLKSMICQFYSRGRMYRECIHQIGLRWLENAHYGEPKHSQPYELNFDRWGSSQSDLNVTLEQQWSSPLPNPIACPQPARRSKARPTSAPKICKASERRPTSGCNRRRRGISGGSSVDSATPRTFVCSFAPYGCESTFVSKNEWKRHVTSQHLQLGFYRCDVGKCNMHTHQASPNRFLAPSPSPKSTSFTPALDQPNDFNRKDLFTQHQRRMHTPWLQSGRRRTPTDTEHTTFEKSLEQVCQRCWHSLRHLPQQSHCGFCRKLFTGKGSWDARMEHVGRHFEREDRASLGEEPEDLSLRDWGLHEGILILAEGKCRLASLVGVEL